MTISIPYMGTKRDIAPLVADIVCTARPGIVLDAFSGMCAIGQAIGERCPVWNNDIQAFPVHVASALFTSEASPPSREEIISSVSQFYHENKGELTHRFAERMNLEEIAISSNTFQSMQEYLKNATHVGNHPPLNEIRRQLTSQPKLFPYCLFTITFSDGYFGFAQSVEIDSIRYAIDQCEERGIMLHDEARWMLISLSHAIAKVSTTTGHFAQYLNINENNSKNYIAKRQRSIWDTWLECMPNLNPVGTKRWRKKNRVFNMDSLSLLQRLSMTTQKPSVVYADPPYTKDQYSRYYHIWETLIKYDYPVAQGKGRYREDRFSSPFSTQRSIRWAFHELIDRTKALKADFVLSYPSKGLLQQAGFDPLLLLREKYKNVDIAFECNHQHSTMGASKGMAKTGVVERVYWARG